MITKIHCTVTIDIVGTDATELASTLVMALDDGLIALPLMQLIREELRTIDAVPIDARMVKLDISDIMHGEVTS